MESLAIPPAWDEVWICPDADGHLQATGRDGRRRKQYRYHALWTKHANLLKFAELRRFGERLPSLRRRVLRDLKRSSLDRRRVIATVVRLLDRGFLRVGNDDYTRLNRTYGATTLQDRHIEIEEDEVHIHFFGKHRIPRDVRLSDPILAGVLDELAMTPRSRLFRYRNDGRWRDVRPQHVNEYLADTMDGATAKTFRTWHASCQMVSHLRQYAGTSERPKRRHVSEGMQAVAARLGNRPATCRKFYVHPRLVDCYLNGQFPAIDPLPARGLRQNEAIFLGFLTGDSTD